MFKEILRKTRIAKALNILIAVSHMSKPDRDTSVAESKMNHSKSLSLSQEQFGVWSVISVFLRIV